MGPKQRKAPGPEPTGMKAWLKQKSFASFFFEYVRLIFLVFRPKRGKKNLKGDKRRFGEKKEKTERKKNLKEKKRFFEKIEPPRAPLPTPWRGTKNTTGQRKCTKKPLAPSSFSVLGPGLPFCFVLVPMTPLASYTQRWSNIARPMKAFLSCAQCRRT